MKKRRREEEEEEEERGEMGASRDKWESQVTGHGTNAVRCLDELDQEGTDLGDDAVVYFPRSVR